MRDLSTNELGNVYGAGSRGRNCSPQPPSCGKRSKSKGSRGKHSKKSKSKGSRRRC